MPLIGKEITANDVVADPSMHIKKTEDVTTKILGQYTLRQKEKYDFEATKLINGIKEEYGIGVSSLVRIYNASGSTLKFSKQGPDVYGHMYKYPPDQTILNGQWCVFLHVQTLAAIAGSHSCVVYTCANKGDTVDFLCGWMVPWYQKFWSPAVLVSAHSSGYWPDQQSWGEVEKKVNDSSSHSEDSFRGIKATANIGNDSSPIANYVISTT